MLSGPLPFPSRWTFYIDKDGRILHVDKDVKTRTAGATVAETLARLGVDRAQ